MPQNYSGWLPPRVEPDQPELALNIPDKLESRPMSQMLGAQTMSPGQPTGGGGLRGWAGRNSTLLKLLGGLGGLGLDMAVGEGQGTKAFSKTYVDKLQADQAAKRQEDYERDKERRAAAHDVFSKYSGLDLSSMPDFQKEIQGYGQSLIGEKNKYDPTALLAGSAQYGGKLSDLLLAQEAKRAGQLESSKTEAQIRATQAGSEAAHNIDLGHGVMGTREDAVRAELEKRQQQAIAGRQGQQQLFDVTQWERSAQERQAAEARANEAAKNLALLHGSIQGQLAGYGAENRAGMQGAMFGQPFQARNFVLQPPPSVSSQGSAFGVVGGASTTAGQRSNSEVPAVQGKDPQRLIKFQGQLVPFSALPPEMQAKVLELGG